MKKLFALLFAAAVLGMAFVSCGDDKDEPVKPEPTQNLESVYENEKDMHYVFDIDLAQDSSSIYIYNVMFAPGAPSLTIRIDAPVTTDRSGKVYTYAGTNIMPYAQLHGVMLRMTDEVYRVTNLLCNVNTEAKTYDIKFDCHGGHFENAGKLK
jgi:hypothetical protein